MADRRFIALCPRARGLRQLRPQPERHVGKRWFELGDAVDTAVKRHHDAAAVERIEHSKPEQAERFELLSEQRAKQSFGRRLVGSVAGRGWLRPLMPSCQAAAGEGPSGRGGSRRISDGGGHGGERSLDDFRRAVIDHPQRHRRHDAEAQPGDPVVARH